ncbi:MAG: hypothetical protein ACK4WH_15850, partial [Phycisphaerales bacterium]
LNVERPTVEEFILIGLSYAKGEGGMQSRRRDYTPTPNGPNTAPADGRVRVGLWRPGTPSSVTMNIRTPGGAVIDSEPTGTCCVGTACSITTQAACGGTFKLIGGSCTPNPCVEPPRGACCRNDGVCRFSTEANCGVEANGVYLGDGTSCLPNPCPSAGACCTGTSCTTVLQASCSGSFLGSGTSCSPNPCSGSCCIGTACTSTYASCCPGTFTPGASCSPNPCEVGACCCGANCALTTAAACSGPTSAFSGAGTACAPYSATAPCC